MPQPSGKAEDQVTPLLITFAHDLRQPLRSIMMLVQRMQRQQEKITEEQLKIQLDEILAAARRQEELIASVVEYDQALQVGLTDDDRRMPLRLVIQTACMKVDSFRKQQNGVIAFDSNSALSISIPAGLARVFEKLLHNALKFHASGAAPAIEVEAFMDDGTPPMANVQITDNGLGIDNEYRKSVFEPFRRLHPYTDYPGPGLGLSTCLRLAESIGGSIAIEDRAQEGPGVRVVVRFPQPT